MPKTSPQRGSRLLTVALLGAIGVAAWVTFVSPSPSGSLVSSTNFPALQVEPTPSEASASGRVLAENVCVTCHLFPEPALADRFTWTNTILPRMSGWLGFDTVDWAGQPGSDRALASGRIPTRPVVDLASLRAIYHYYLNAAPPLPNPQPVKPLLTDGAGPFQVRLGTTAQRSARTTLVKIDEQSRQLWLGQGEIDKISIFAANAVLAATLEMTNPVVHLLKRPDGFYATRIGSVSPSDLAQGDLVHLVRSPAGVGYEVGQVLLSGLRRPVASAAVDLNLDGREDLVVASFGNVLGHFSWYERKPDGAFEEHLLLDRPGAVGVGVHDFDGDGSPDIAVAMAQAQEGIWLFLNRGQGTFQETVVTHKNPAWGFSHLELVDFDQDGQMDLLVTNGDNGDNELRPNCLKPYHGIRLYLNQGQGEFREAWFYPMYGAYRALARDFDLDGDLDIAAVAFFPDYSAASNESFVYLENLGLLNFKASTMVQGIAGRWITLDAGDLDGDGDVDIVLGASNVSFGDVPRILEQSWDERGPSMLLLENQSRK